jgi:hypothetical protein
MWALSVIEIRFRIPRAKRVHPPNRCWTTERIAEALPDSGRAVAPDLLFLQETQLPAADKNAPRQYGLGRLIEGTATARLLPSYKLLCDQCG